MSPNNRNRLRRTHSGSTRHSEQCDAQTSQLRKPNQATRHRHTDHAHAPLRRELRVLARLWHVPVRPPEEPARAMSVALEEAKLTPADIQYVNLHGTSTEMNDRVETRALKLALGEHAHKIPMSGLKSQIGHAQGACGSASVAATLIAMEHGKIPPTINLDVPDPECETGWSRG